MIRLFFVTFIIGLGLPGAALHASPRGDIVAVAKLRPSSSSYYSAMDGHVTISYINSNIPSESKIYLRHGFLRSEFYQGKLYPSSSWTDLQLATMKNLESSTWQTTIVKQLYTRGSSSHLTGIDFVFEIHLPDGKILFDKGSDSRLGYYNGLFPLYSDPCNIESSPGCEVTVTEVLKD